MTPDPGDRFERLATILDEAPTNLEPPDLQAWLDTACGDDPWLRTQVSELLEHRAGVPTAFLTPPGAEERERPLPARIGPFHVTGHLGRGGMGEVFVGHDPGADRAVAIKVVRSGASGDEVLARFENERRLLARMNHPGIARVWSVGRTDDHEPWLAMELVPDAVDLVTEAARRSLDVRARVGMMAAVCDAVHHAHQKGVVHRDLKPGNIVVAANDESPVPRPRVIDFGVARLVDEAAMLDFRTRAGQLIGTQAYMAPEQARDPAAADVRSDVFALGTVLYELLTGRRAFRSAGSPPAVAPIRAGGPFPIPPDLDLIVRTAIAEDPALRYGSAEAMAADLRRFLADAPIAARPPTATYLARKFVRRHRAAVAISAASLLLLVATTVVATHQAIRATRAELTTRQAAYRTGIVAAAGSVRERDGVAAAAFLDELPVDARGWEWAYLDRLARGFRRRTGDFGIWLRTIAQDGDGRLVVQPMVASDGDRTDPPAHRAGVLVLAGDGMMVDDGRALCWADRELRVVETDSAEVVALREPPFTVQAAALRGDELLALDGQWTVRRTTLGGTDWVVVGRTDERLGVAEAIRSLPGGRALVLHRDGFTTIGGPEPEVAVRFGTASQTGVSALSADGGLVATLMTDDRVLIHETATGTLVQKITGVTATGTVVAFDDDASHLAIGSTDGSLEVMERSTGRRSGPTRLGHVGAVTAIAFGQGDRLHSADFGGSLLTWDLGPEASVPVTLAHGSAVSHVSFADDGRLETLSIIDGHQQWEGPAIAPEAAAPVPQGAWHLRRLPESGERGGSGERGEHGRVSVTHDGTLVIERRDGREELRPFDGAETRDLAISPDGRRAALADALAGLAIVDLSTLAVFRPSPATAPVLAEGLPAVAWRDDRRLLCGTDRATLVEHDTATGTTTVLVDGVRVTSIIAAGPDRAFVGTYEGSLLDVDLVSRAVTRTISGHSRAINALAISPDARRLASGDDEGTIRIRNAADGQELLRIEARPSGGVLSLAWSPDGSALASGHTGARALVWATAPPWGTVPRDERSGSGE